MLPLGTDSPAMVGVPPTVPGGGGGGGHDALQHHCAQYCPRS